jgi:peptidoglycan/LPS O-acetylase OafA/YrhL
LNGQRLSLGAFYARRALRTWPAFWVVLAAYFLFPTDLGGNTPPPLWRFLSFTQNWALQPGTALSHAWSLCIEEQFYLVLPLAALLAARLGMRRRPAWVVFGALVALGIKARGLLSARHGLDSGDIAGYHPRIYYATLCRFDEFVPGVALALWSYSIYLTHTAVGHVIRWPTNFAAPPSRATDVVSHAG